jgi:hypothetical protein
VTAKVVTGTGIVAAGGIAIRVSTRRMSAGTGFWIVGDRIVGDGTVTAMREDGGATAGRETAKVNEDVTAWERTVGVVTGTAAMVCAGMSFVIAVRKVVGNAITIATTVMIPSARVHDRTGARRRAAAATGMIAIGASASLLLVAGVVGTALCTRAGFSGAKSSMPSDASSGNSHSAV